MQEPIISQYFTTEDIRKIREYNDEIAMTMTLKEYRDYLYRETEPVVREIETRRRERQNNFSEGVSP
ncbi:MAG: hypothetical protein LBL87_05605 [Ruminococcus sp.]|nr:hypothetical protein [Ruminococcus sp.]